MRNKDIYEFNNVEQKILNAVAKLADPVVQTLSPRGGNVLYNDNDGVVVSNDGISIAKSIKSDDNFENTIINTIKESSFKTNSEAGDGTTTSILLTSVLLREGIKLRRDGINPQVLIKALRDGGKKLLDRVKEMTRVAETDEDILNIAKISSNNDLDIAEKVLKTVKVAGIDGMVFLEPNNKETDEIIEDIGFIIKAGMFRPELRNGPGFAASYAKVPVFVTDKRIYYKEEAEAILRAVYDAGFTEVVIVARDFIGEAVNWLLQQHASGKFKILLVKDPNTTETDYTRLEDLAAYLDGPVVTEKQGSLVNNKLSIKNFSMADRVFADGQKTIIFKDNNNTNVRLSMWLSSIREEYKKDKDNDVLKERIASLTNGMVTLKVGAPTLIEMRERLFRFEDAINAARSAMKHGYLVGGGVTLLNSYNAEDYPEEYRQLFKKYTEASVSQIARNCGREADTVVRTIKELQEDMENKDLGFDASTLEVEDLLERGVIDPYQVLALAIQNSISAACNILSVNYFVINKPEDKEDKPYGE